MATYTRGDIFRGKGGGLFFGAAKRENVGALVWRGMMGPYGKGKMGKGGYGGYGGYGWQRGTQFFL